MAAPAAIHLKVDLVYSENNLSFIEVRFIRDPILNYKPPKNKKITKKTTITKTKKQRLDEKNNRNINLIIYEPRCFN